MCLTAPPDEVCLAFHDFDVAGESDGRVDLGDFGGLANCFRSPGQTPPPECFRPAPAGEAPGSGSFALHGSMVDVLSGGRGPGDELALQYSRARYFDLKHGRFLQRDPKGYIDGANLYEAFASNPARFTDPMGTDLRVEGTLPNDWENEEETARIQVWLDRGWRRSNSLLLATFLLDIQREKVLKGQPATRAWVTLGQQRYRVRLAAFREWVTKNLNRDISALGWGSLEPTDRFVQTLVVSSFTDWLINECSGIVNVETGEPLPGWNPDDPENVAVRAASVQRGLDEAQAMAQAGLKSEIYALATAAFAEAAWKGIQFAKGVRVLPGSSSGVRVVRTDPVEYGGAHEYLITYKIRPGLTPMQGARKTGISRAWKLEAQLVRATGRGTVDWTAEQAAELLRTGEVRGFTGHHINCVEQYPTWAGDPRNIRFLSNSPAGGEHIRGLQGHRGNWRSPTSGRLIDREAMIRAWEKVGGLP